MRQLPGYAIKAEAYQGAFFTEKTSQRNLFFMSVVLWVILGLCEVPQVKAGDTPLSTSTGSSTVTTSVTTHIGTGTNPTNPNPANPQTSVGFLGDTGALTPVTPSSSSTVTTTATATTPVTGGVLTQTNSPINTDLTWVSTTGTNGTFTSGYATSTNVGTSTSALTNTTTGIVTSISTNTTTNIAINTSTNTATSVATSLATSTATSIATSVSTSTTTSTTSNTPTSTGSQVSLLSTTTDTTRGSMIQTSIATNPTSNFISLTDVSHLARPAVSTATFVGTSTNTSIALATTTLAPGSSNPAPIETSPALNTTAAANIRTESSAAKTVFSEKAFSPFGSVEVDLTSGNHLSVYFKDAQTLIIEEFFKGSQASLGQGSKYVFNIQEATLYFFPDLDERSRQVLGPTSDPEEYAKKMSEMIYKADGALREAFKGQIPAALLSNLNRLIGIYENLSGAVSPAGGGALHPFSNTVQPGSLEIDDGPESKKEKSDQNKNDFSKDQPLYKLDSDPKSGL